MAKVNKEFELRMQGMILAQHIVKTEGIEALDKEIDFRGKVKIPPEVPKPVIQNIISTLGENIYTTVLTVCFMALEKEGWRKTRLKRFKEEYDKATASTYDMNWLGNHYVTMQDYVNHLKYEYDIDLDTDVAVICQESADKNNPDYKMVHLDRLVNELKEAGHGHAACWLLDNWKNY